MELLVVLAILGFLAAIATPMVLHNLDLANVDCQDGGFQHSAGLDLFKYDVGRYPTTEEGLKALLEAPAGVEIETNRYVKKTMSWWTRGGAVH